MTGTRGERPRALAIGAGVAAAAIAFCAFPLSAGIHSSLGVAAILRGSWAGLVGGLSEPHRPLFGAAVRAAIGAAVGALMLRLGLGVIPAWAMVVGVGLAGLVALAMSLLALKMGLRAASSAALVIVFIGLAWQIGVIPGPFSAAQRSFFSDVAQEPVAEHYGFDGKIYLKTMFLMKRGIPYYAAFSQAMVDDKGYVRPPVQVFNYREPWPARLVASLPGNAGIDAWLVFAAIVCLGIVGAFFLASRWVTPGVALLGPMLIATYYVFSLTSKWFPFVELWAGAVAICAIAALLAERWWLGVALVTVAVAMRELMVYLIPVALLAALVSPRRRELVPQMIALVVLPSAVLAYHTFSVPVHLDAAGSSGGISTWLHGSVGNLVAALRFSDRNAVWGRLIFPVVPVVALLGGLQVRGAWRKVMLASAVVIPTAALGLFSNGVYGYYWGAIAQPLMLGLVPLLFVAFLPATPERDASAPASGSNDSAQVGYDTAAMASLEPEAS